MNKKTNKYLNKNQKVWQVFRATNSCVAKIVKKDKQCKEMAIEIASQAEKAINYYSLVACVAVKRNENPNRYVLECTSALEALTYKLHLIVKLYLNKWMLNMANKFQKEIGHG